MMSGVIGIAANPKKVDVEKLPIITHQCAFEDCENVMIFRGLAELHEHKEAGWRSFDVHWKENWYCPWHAGIYSAINLGQPQ